MEKRRPSYDLDAIKRAMHSPDALLMTRTAIRDSTLLGFDRQQVVRVIQSIGRAMFYKSMTTIEDNRIWQDVYHVPARGLVLYVKFQNERLTDFKLVSFKER